MQANMVFTVEPGIYIPAEGFGIRLKTISWFKKAANHST
jgi:Xaa-Pro aminopeptidase